MRATIVHRGHSVVDVTCSKPFRHWISPFETVQSYLSRPTVGNLIRSTRHHILSIRSHRNHSLTMHSVTLFSIGLLAAIAQAQSEGKSGSDSTGSNNSTDTSGNPTLQSGDDDSAMSSGMVTSTMAAMSCETSHQCPVSARLTHLSDSWCSSNVCYRCGRRTS